MPSVNKAEGKLELPGGVSIFLTRIGPGVFFALFGCAIIGYSVTKPVEFTLPTVASSGRAISYSAVGQRDRPVNPLRDIAISGLDPEVVVARLNGFLEERPPEHGPACRSGAGGDDPRGKIRRHADALEARMGRPDKFERWARENGDRDPPDDLVPGATLVYRTVL